MLIPPNHLLSVVYLLHYCYLVTAPELRGLWFYFKELASSGSGSGERNEDDDHIDSA